MLIKDLPNLNESTLAALDYFIKTIPIKLNLKIQGLPFVVGSGNAFNASKVIFNERVAIFANESNFKQKLANYQKLIKNKTIKEAIIISTSGEKDAVWEIEIAQKNGLKTTLLTCEKNSTGAKIANKVIVYKKISEPQTYNISTYLGMILSHTGESAKKIKSFIATLKLPKNYKDYNAYTFILPDSFSQIAPMIEIKKHELFGPRLSIRAFSEGESRHAKFVIPWEKELVISLGKNKFFGIEKNRWEIKMPKQYQAGLVMALTYYLIGLVQRDKEPFFKKNIAAYCLNGPKAYHKNKPFDIVVPGN